AENAAKAGGPGNNDEKSHETGLLLLPDCEPRLSGTRRVNGSDWIKAQAVNWPWARKRASMGVRLDHDRFEMNRPWSYSLYFLI
ncbi:MAG: hypothetical protein WBV25_13415, partial [Methylocella sp.]